MKKYIYQLMRKVLIKIFLNSPLFISPFLYRLQDKFLVSDYRKPYFDRVFKEVKSRGTLGDYLEFGVYKGKSLVMAYKLAEKYKLEKMRFFAFDSFQGLPHSEGDVFFKSQFCSSEHFFRKFVHKAGIDPERIVVVKGFFKNTLTNNLKKKAELKKAAIIHIDCDLYSSTREVLRFIEDVIDIGTIIIFDDWFSFHDDNHEYKRGERAAFTEWESSKLFEVFYEYKTKAFIMIKNR